MYATSFWYIIDIINYHLLSSLGDIMDDDKDEKVIVRELEDAHEIEQCLENIVSDEEKLKDVKKEIEDCMLDGGKK